MYHKTNKNKRVDTEFTVCYRSVRNHVDEMEFPNSNTS